MEHVRPSTYLSDTGCRNRRARRAIARWAAGRCTTHHALWLMRQAILRFYQTDDPLGLVPARR